MHHPFCPSILLSIRILSIPFFFVYFFPLFCLFLTIRFSCMWHTHIHTHLYPPSFSAVVSILHLHHPTDLISYRLMVAAFFFHSRKKIKFFDVAVYPIALLFFWVLFWSKVFPYTCVSLLVFFFYPPISFIYNVCNTHIPTRSYTHTHTTCFQ